MYNITSFIFCHKIEDNVKLEMWMTMKDVMRRVFFVFFLLHFHVLFPARIRGFTDRAASFRIPSSCCWHISSDKVNSECIIMYRKRYKDDNRNTVYIHSHAMSDTYELKLMFISLSQMHIKIFESSSATRIFIQ